MATAPTMLVSTRAAYGGPDTGLAAFQLDKLQKLFALIGPYDFAKRAFWIIRKNPEEGEIQILPSDSKFWNRRLVPFVHNQIQQDLDKKIIVAKSRRNIMLKPRQAGYTTWSIIMRLLLPAILEPGTGSMLISQNAEYATAHFDILKLAHRMFFMADPNNSNDPANEWAQSLRRNLLHVAYSNRRELIFDVMQSRVRCASAEVEETGQGLTLQHLVCTEVSRWQHKPEETMANVKEAIPENGTLDIECTPNGMGGYFYDEWVRATNPVKGKKREFTPHFHTWYWHEEYKTTPGVDISSLEPDEKALMALEIPNLKRIDTEQIAWRREKVESLRHNFAEKYPEDDLSCFLAEGQFFFEREILAMRLKELQSYKPLQNYNKFVRFKNAVKHRRYIIGADPATGMAITSQDPDRSAAVVIDLDTGEEMAAYAAFPMPEEFAEDLYELAKEYNDAEICVERLSEGGTVITTLQSAFQYWNLYKHKDWWRKDLKNSKEMIGFPTNTRNRPIALNRIRWFAAESPHLIYDVEFVKEALAFVRDEKGIPHAQEGRHDDRVLCRALAHWTRHVRLGWLTPETIPRREKYGEMPREFQPWEMKQ